MDWDVLLGPHGEDIEGLTHCLTDYLNFCVDVVAPAKTYGVTLIINHG